MSEAIRQCSANLASVSATRDILQRFGLNTKHSLGQHFLIDNNVLNKICDLAAIGIDDCVVEIGCGIGTLTCELLKRAKQVIGIEYDSSLFDALEFTTSDYRERFTLIAKDALDVVQSDFSSTPYLPNSFVANLPYNIAATALLRFFEEFESIETATVMVQHEVADRICAKPGNKNYGAYTVKLSFYAEVVERFAVSKRCFYPPPRVRSSVVKLHRKTLSSATAPSYTPGTRRAALLAAEAAFFNRRKTVLNSFKAYLAQDENIGGKLPTLSDDALKEMFKRSHIDPRQRAENLCCEDFLSLAEALEHFAES